MIRTRLLSMTALAALMCAPALAQTSNPSAAPSGPDPTRPVTGIGAEETTGETIIITGSRIRRAGFDTLEPASVVSSEYLAVRGLTNVADALNEIPGFGVGVNPDGAQSTFGVGQNFVNRFGLGSARTLTLVNGRRFVTTNAASIFGNTPGLQVDLNVIPSQLVDRIENLAIGGAPTYGSDAIAGTVNVILKRNFDGVQVAGLGGITQRGDNGRYNISVMAGKNFADGRGNIMGAVSYDRAQGVFGNERKIFRDGIATGTNPTVGATGNAAIPGRTAATDGRLFPNVPFNTNNTDGIPSTIYIRNARIFSLTAGGLLLPATGANTTSLGFPTGFGAANTLIQFDSSGNLVPFNPGTPFGAQNASGGDGFSLVSETNQLTSTLERITGNLIGRFDLTEDISLFGEGTYYRAKGFELIDQSIYNATLFGGASAPLLFQSTDPRLTPQARATLASLGVTSFRLSRASRDLVNNNANATTTVYRGVGGIEADFQMFGRQFNFEAAAVYGKSIGKFFSTVLNQQRFVNAINNCQVAGVTAANNVAPGGILPIADPSCVPLDVFGEGRSSLAARNYVTGITRARASQEQQVYTANFGSAELLSLWAGDVGFNLGYEHRREKAEFSPDAFQRAGSGRSVPIGPNTGKFRTDEAFGEILIPLLSAENGIPLVERIEVEGKARYVDNSINGGFWAYTYGGRFQPIPDIEFRGNYTRSLRSPSVVEAFTPVSPAFNTFPDPCDRALINSGTNPAVRARNCAAFYQSYGLNGAAFDSLARVATVPVTSGGNTSLKNEEGRSYTFGMVFKPRFIPRFRAAVDWNRIYIKGNIASLTPANIAEGCYDNPDFNASDVDNANPFCSLIRRDRTPGNAPRNGQLSLDNTRPGLATNFVNGAFIKFKGLTAEVEYNMPLGGIGINDGTLDLGGTFFYLNKYQSSNNGVTVVNQKGTIGLPVYQGQINVGLTVGKVGIDLQSNYTSKAYFDRTFTAESRDILTVSDYWSFNLATVLQVTKTSLFRFTVSNLFDRRPPYPLTTNALGVYDFLGRRFAVSFQHKL